jgi:CRISPR-associated protein Csy2
MQSLDEPDLVLAIPRVRVQNANLLSSPITWGFPSPTALVGLGEALHRRVRRHDIVVRGAGVVCHRFEPQIARRTNEPSLLRLTRNPLVWKGEIKPPALVEEGRTHLEVTFLFGLSGPGLYEGDRDAVLGDVGEKARELRFAGGTLLPPSGRGATLESVSGSASPADARGFLRKLLPGFAMVSREGVLGARTEALRQQRPEATSFDALLDLVRLHHDCRPSAEDPTRGEWSLRKRTGWIVPLTCGFRGISPLYAPGDVPGARDTTTPVRFVEAIYTAGEWLSPHRVDHPSHLLWYPVYEEDRSLYRVTTPHYGKETEHNLSSRSI